MVDETQSGMTCAEFEGLLGDALDLRLPGPQLQAFQSHGASCSLCGPLWKDAEAGRTWLHSLQEVDPPAQLVNRILVATSGRQARHSAATPSRATWWEQFSGTVLAPLVAVVRQPRFVMSFGMAFFAVSICLSLAGIRLSDLHAANLRPSALKRNYYETSGRVVKYYENIRFVYEMESRVREFKRVAVPDEPTREEKNLKHKNDTSSRPDEKNKNEDRNYSQGETTPLLAKLGTAEYRTASIPGRSL